MIMPKLITKKKLNEQWEIYFENFNACLSNFFIQEICWQDHTDVDIATVILALLIFTYTHLMYLPNDFFFFFCKKYIFFKSSCILTTNKMDGNGNAFLGFQALVLEMVINYKQIWQHIGNMFSGLQHWNFLQNDTLAKAWQCKVCMCTSTHT